MTTALTKVDTPLMERYETTCTNCGWLRQFFGTATEARKSAETMGWEFRQEDYVLNEYNITEYNVGFTFMKVMLPFPVERAYCPHCSILTKGDSPCPSSK